MVKSYNRAFNCDFSFLEVIILNPLIDRWMIIELSGYSEGSFQRSVSFLRFHDFILRRSGYYYATEKGKIAWAIWKGKQKRKHAA